MASFLARFRRAGPDQSSLLESGIRAFDAGDLDAARRAFEAAVKAHPDDARALNLLGVVAMACGQLEMAERNFRAALAIDANMHGHWFNLGNALAGQQRFADAVAAYEAALARSPADFATLFNLARANSDAGNLDRAVDAARRATEAAPGHAGARIELGTLLVRRASMRADPACLSEAAAILEAALSLPQIDAMARHNARLFLAEARTMAGQPGTALPYLQALHQAAPDDIEGLIKLANCLNTLGMISVAAPYYARVVALVPTHLPAISSAISSAEYLAEVLPAENTSNRRKLMQAFADPLRATSWSNSRDPGRRLRIGYLSPDFRSHVAMVLFEDVLRHHDTSAFEVYCYDAASQRDAKNRELRTLAGHWREIDTLSTQAAFDLIRGDGIDILVDLAGHTAGNRLMVFARKPAPVQASWLAYPGSTGLPEIDYLVSDAVTSPPQFEHHASEKIWRLPGTRFCYTPLPDAPAAALPGAETRPTFACFNNVSKLNLRVLALWRRLMAEVPEARLILKSGALDAAPTHSWLSGELLRAGIDPGRVELRGGSSYASTLAEYADVHVALDPFPFCGGLTSLDALWMGVPVVTLEQELMAGRQTQAFLHCLGATGLVASDEEDYVRIAAALVRDRARLAAYRQDLRSRMLSSALCDHAGFTRAIEAAWRAMWQRWCAA
ncbi:MAG: tetratricopeptide repeat protein [Burkholderiales bacterium]